MEHEGICGRHFPYLLVLSIGPVTWTQLLGFTHDWLLTKISCKEIIQVASKIPAISLDWKYYCLKSTDHQTGQNRYFLSIKFYDQESLETPSPHPGLSHHLSQTESEWHWTLQLGPASPWKSSFSGCWVFSADSPVLGETDPLPAPTEKIASSSKQTNGCRKNRFLKCIKSDTVSSPEERSVSSLGSLLARLWLLCQWCHKLKAHLYLIYKTLSFCSLKSGSGRKENSAWPVGARRLCGGFRKVP